MYAITCRAWHHDAPKSSDHEFESSLWSLILISRQRRRSKELRHSLRTSAWEATCRYTKEPISVICLSVLLIFFFSSFIHSFFHSLTHSFTHSLTHSSIHPSVRPCVCAFVRSFVDSSVYLFSFFLSLLFLLFLVCVSHSLTHSFIHVSIHPSVVPSSIRPFSNFSFFFLSLPFLFFLFLVCVSFFLVFIFSSFLFPLVSSLFFKKKSQEGVCWLSVFLKC